MSYETKVSTVMSAEDFVETRDRIVTLITKAVDSLGDAEQLLGTVSTYGFNYDRHTFYRVCDESQRRKIIGELTKQTDRKLWDRIIELGKFRELMTINERRKIDEQLDKCPPVTLATVTATYAQLKANRPNMLQDLVSTAFLERDKSYKTNAGMGINKKQVINRVYCRFGYTNFGSRACDRLDDICKAIGIITGLEKPNITNILSTKSEHVDFGGAVRFQAFKNGNVHLWIEDKTILDKLNDILAGSMGAKVGEGK